MGIQSLAQTIPDLKSMDSKQLLVGIVIDNNDPTKKQRVRVQIPGLLEGDAELLPWFIPRRVSPYGVGDDYGVVCIPRNGSRVYVTFQEGDGSFGEYLADVVSTSTTPPAELLTNYPDRIGFFTPIGDIAYLDLKTKDMFLRRASGTGFKIDTDGNVTLVCAKDFTQTVKGNYTVSIEGEYNVSAKGAGTIDINGDVQFTVGGSEQHKVGGSQTVSVSSSRTVSCSSESHSGAINNLGDVVADGISLKSHKHGGVDTGGGVTQPPI